MVDTNMGPRPRSVEAAERLATTARTDWAIGKLTFDQYVENLYSLSQTVQEMKLRGDSDDWHNFAVNFARIDDEAEACKILKRGIEQHPYSVDLLSDFLSYGLSCGEDEQCETYYKIVVDMPLVKTTWRGFTFVIDYLLAKFEKSCSESEIDQLWQAMNERVLQFKQRFPYDERAYLSNAEVLLAFGKEDEAAEVLKDAMGKFAAPKCCLKYADMMLRRGCFEEVQRAARLGISCSAQEQAGVNLAYLVYQLALAMDAQLHADDAFNNKERVLEVLRHYAAAENSFDKGRSAYLENIHKRRLILEAKIDIRTHMEFANDNDAVD